MWLLSWPYVVAGATALLWWLWRWQRERQTVGQLHDRFVFITGCDSGFGHQLATQLDRRGLRVLAACLTERGAEQLRRKASGRLQTVLLDVTRPESVRAAAQWAREAVGERGLWGLVNNAGIAFPMVPNEWLTKEDFTKVLDVNLLGLIDVTLTLLPLVKRARGRIVNVASVMGRLSVFGGGYCISKFGVEAFSDSLRRELFHFGVKVAIIEPGNFRTQILAPENMRALVAATWSRAPPGARESYGDVYLDSYCRGLERLISEAKTDLSPVYGCMTHALTAVHPRTRYAPGRDAQFIYLPLSYLPTSLSDFLLRSFLSSVPPARAR
ncbi:retinol dehydrogenase 7-like [Tachyglossus aculeatus]|uniref:retinol dehydrogenase 7-like n=1 Tax=Tachyglossus aculeatus TaxID=9261 RepID=UPI0018F41C76|nr:retinol dehydrogenase 7-like [Tachyglossus aculeatus]XP_038608572.1 retinol dehydrogenase 7-like [Tachyglossus aculeatus]